MPFLRPISDAEYAIWVNATIPAYARDKVESGAWAAAESLERSKAELESLLPDGKDTKDNFLYSVLAEDGGRVGMLWFSVKERANARIAYVYNIEIDTEHRRRGHAQRALQALEEEARRLGLAGVALHVFGHNTAAQALYAKLGYLATNINMYKAVGTGA
ncbi:MAG: N-acetyltransferase family protein [Candidatus Levyibacteriota bacterium]